MLTFRPDTDELYVLPICSAQHGNGVESQHAHGWLPWPTGVHARAHPLELTSYQREHPHNSLWAPLYNYQSREQQHPLHTCIFFPVDL